MTLAVKRSVINQSTNEHEACICNSVLIHEWLPMWIVENLDIGLKKSFFTRKDNSSSIYIGLKSKENTIKDEIWKYLSMHEED